MPHKPATYNLADGNWNMIADYTTGAAADQPRLVRVTNTGTAGQVMFAPGHLADGETPGGGDVGIDVAQDDYVEIGAARPGNGNVLQVWAKGNGMTGKISPVM